MKLLREERFAQREAARKLKEAIAAKHARARSPQDLTGSAAAAEAAQNIRMGAAMALPEGVQQRRPGDDLWGRFGGGRIEELVADAFLVDARWLIDLAEAGGVLPRCQEVPLSARIGVDQLWRLRFAWDQSDCLSVLVRLSMPFSPCTPLHAFQP